MKDFIQEEKGHDQIILDSLRALDISNVDNIYHPQETDLMMHSLRKSSMKNAIAFLQYLDGLKESLIQTMSTFMNL